MRRKRRGEGGKGRRDNQRTVKKKEVGKGK